MVSCVEAVGKGVNSCRPIAQCQGRIFPQSKVAISDVIRRVSPIPYRTRIYTQNDISTVRHDELLIDSNPIVDPIINFQSTQVGIDPELL